MPPRLPFVTLDAPVPACEPPQPPVDPILLRDAVAAVVAARAASPGSDVFGVVPGTLQTADTFPPPPPLHRTVNTFPRHPQSPSWDVAEVEHDDPEPPTGSWRWRIAFAGTTAAAVAYWLKFILPLLV